MLESINHKQLVRSGLQDLNMGTKPVYPPYRSHAINNYG